MDLIAAQLKYLLKTGYDALRRNRARSDAEHRSEGKQKDFQLSI